MVRRPDAAPQATPPTNLHVHPGKPAAAPAAAGKSIVIVDDDELHRSMLYALGARSVANKMMAHVELVVHGRPTPPQKARARYPSGEFMHADAIVPIHAGIDARTGPVNGAAISRVWT